MKSTLTLLFCLLICSHVIAEEEIENSPEKIYVSFKDIHLLPEGILVNVKEKHIKVPQLYKNEHGYYISLNESKAPRDRWYCLACGYSNPKREAICECCRTFRNEL